VKKIKAKTVNLHKKMNTKLHTAYVNTQVPCHGRDSYSTFVEIGTMPWVGFNLTTFIEIGDNFTGISDYFRM
jgi:hypothetical protein